MSHFKIIFLDIDGTILTPEDEIQDSTKLAIKQMKEKDLEVFLATGRPLHEISHIGEILNIKSMIGYNGAYAVHEEQDIFQRTMDPQLVKAYLHIAKEHNNELILYTSTHNLLSNPESNITKKFTKKFHLKANLDYSDEWIDKILGITLLNVKDEEISKYESFPLIHLSQVNVDGYRDSYDVISDEVNKGFAVATILKKLGLKKENSIAFGDGLNDKEMLQTVGEGFAMGNASEKLFSYAKHRTTTVTNSGIYNGLKSLGLID